jgi:deoxyribose-phosphate aldolase
MTSQEKLAKLMEHTNLKPWATEYNIKTLCDEATRYKFHSVVVYGYWVPDIREWYPDLKIVQVLNFPDGLSYSITDTLAQIHSEANEYDIVINISELKDAKLTNIHDELKAVKSYIGTKVLKVIVESAVLKDTELYSAMDILATVGADFIKTSTGTVVQTEDCLIEQVTKIQNYKRLHQLPMEIKASGGIKTLALVKILMGLGVTRFGSSNTVQILKELPC